ncbi:MAG: hypothetical protein ABR905_16390 [Terracidiphilus sp.]|jgi:hypothetical protein
MHFNFKFSAPQILWTLNFAADLVLLVVLLGRDRARRYPWFTASIVFFTLRLLAEELLANRMPSLLYQQIVLAFGDMAAVMGLMVLIELARRAFAGARSSILIVNTAGVLLVAGGVLAVSGPWPALKVLDLSSMLGKLRLMQLVALKGDALDSILAVELGLLVVFFGRYFKAGWRSHTQQIAIGLSTVAITLLTIQTALQSIIKSAQANPPGREGYQHIMGLLGKLSNANRVVYIAVLLWWIVWLWIDEPGAPETPATEPAEEPAAAEE